MKKNKSNLCVGLSFSGTSLYLGLFCGRAVGSVGSIVMVALGLLFWVGQLPGGLGGLNTPQLIGGSGAKFVSK